MQPVIGITTSFERGEIRLDPRYALAVERSGGIPVLIPCVSDQATAVAVLDIIDGLVLPGGPAVTEGLIGELPDDLPEADAARIRTDRWMLEGTLERGLPILGICYGMQLVNAYFGGTIYADVEAQLALDAPHSEQRGGSSHGLVLEPGTTIAHVLSGVRSVNSRHIQAVADVGRGLRVGARAPDGIIEALEAEAGRFIGLQFHVERMGVAGKPVFDHLIELAGPPRSRARQ